MPRGLSSELGIPHPPLPQSTVKQPKSGHLRVENRSGSMSSIKRDVKKKVFPRPEVEKILVSSPAHCL